MYCSISCADCLSKSGLMSPEHMDPVYHVTAITMRKDVLQE